MEWHIVGILAFVVLDSFFGTARKIAVEIEKCKLQECEK